MSAHDRLVEADAERTHDTLPDAVHAELRHAKRLARSAAAAAVGLVVLAGAVAWLDVGLVVDAARTSPAPGRAQLAVLVCVAMVLVLLWRAAVNWRVYLRVTRAVRRYEEPQGSRQYDAAARPVDERALIHAVRGAVSVEMAAFIRQR